MQHTTFAHINDVDLGSIGDLVGSIRRDPERAKTMWSAQVTWAGGFRSEASIRHFGPLPSDEPPALGGGDSAPNPVEQLLAAFGNCLAVGYAANASSADISIHELTIEVEGDLNLHTFLGLQEGHAGFDDIRVRVRLITDAGEDEIRALHDRVTSTSPVGHTLGRAIPVAVTID